MTNGKETRKVNNREVGGKLHKTLTCLVVTNHSQLYS